LGILVTALFAAQAPKGGQYDDRIARAVVRFLELGHIAKPRINDEVASRWFQNYFESFDPLKYYFVKADIEGFREYEKKIDDAIKAGDLSFAYKVYNKFQERAKQRRDDAEALLKEPVDFTLDETLVDDPKLLDWPADDAEAKDRLRKLIKYDLLRGKLLGETSEETIKRLGIRYRDLYRRYRDPDNSEILEQYLTALASAIDPHSSYMSGKTFEDFMNQQMQLTLDGIGASLSTEDGYPVVRDIVPGGAADKDGRLQIDDKILGIENPDGTREDFVEKKLNDVVRKIRGPRGTKVRLIVQPADTNETKIYELTRQKIELVESRAKSKLIEQKVDGREEPLKIGIIQLPGFYGDTQAEEQGDPSAASATKDTRKLLNELKQQGADVVLMDLRGNGGGLLSQAVSLSGLFIDQGPVVQIREASGVKQIDDQEAGTAWDGPLVVLIDKFSASASEIFAGMIQDYGRGIIVGDASTFGKGTVQTLVPLNERLGVPRDRLNLGAVKLTIQQFYRPNGASTQMQGVAPDIHIPSASDLTEMTEAKLDAALKFDRVPAVPHDQYNRLSPELIAQLNERSAARRAANPKFKEDMELLEKLKERKKRHQITLNEQQFRAEMRADKDEEAEIAKKRKERQRRHVAKDVWESNHYNDEILSIVGDYMTLGKQILIAAPTPAAARAGEPPTLMP
jgi:carboxyl-terminal processing protease